MTEDPFPDSAGIWLQSWDPDLCLGGLWDPDYDGIHNGCENALAQKFAPLFVVAGDCNWDHTPGFDRMGGEYFFAVEGSSIPGNLLRIAYLPAYYLDCGTPADMFSICTAIGGLGLEWCEGHSGDSEFILIDVSFNYTTSHWVTEDIFLSAHCGEPITGGNCQWWSRDRFQWRDGRFLGAPEIWVAVRKHANYYSQDKCNGGALGMDECSYNTMDRLFPVVYTQQNVGSRGTPLRDCAEAFWGSPMAPGYECIWTKPFPNDRFWGWQSQYWNNGSDSYSDHLLEYADF